MFRVLSRVFIRFCFAFLLWPTSNWAILACGAADYPSDQIVVRQIAGVRRTGRFVPPFCYEWFVRAELFAARGELDKAVEAYRLALTGPEEDVFVLTRLAVALHQLGHTEASQEVLERAESIDGRSEAVWLTRARFAEQDGDYQAAVSAYQRAEAVAPLSDEPPFALAKLLSGIGAGERAIAVLEGFAARTQENSARAERAKLALCLARRDAKGAFEAAQTMLRIAPIKEKEICSAISLALDSGEPFVAERLFSQLPATYCEKSLRLRLFLNVHRYAAAEQLLASALPETFGGVVPTARAYLAIDRPDLAEQIAQELLTREESSEAMVISAKCKLRQGRFTEAAELFSRIESGTTCYEGALIGLAQALSFEGMGGEAAEILATAPQSTSAIRSALAEQRYNQGDFIGAVAALSSNADSTPQTEEAKAAMLERCGETEEAFRIYARLGKDRRAKSRSSRALAERLIAQRDLKGAIQLLETEAKASPANLLARLRLAEVKAQTGDRDAARTIARALLRVTWEPALRKRALAIAAQ